MCGLIGAIGPIPKNLPDLEHAIHSLRHRGPDACGTVLKGTVALGHVRLSIVDIANQAANQPMTDPRTGNILIYNGEIYNFRALRKTYLQKRCFLSDSDTEVLLYLLSDLGLEKTLSLISGMFAFALYRPVHGDLILCRDPIGKKPLFYTIDGNGNLLFSSEIKGLAALGVCLEPSRSAVVNFLFERSFGHGTGSFFENINQVQAGGWLRIDSNLDRQTGRYWYPEYIEQTDMSYANAVNRFSELLIEATLTRIPDEVPFAILLSGGLDSSAIAALAATHAGREAITTVSAVYPGDPDDESHYADQVRAMYPTLSAKKVAIPTDNFAEAWVATTHAMEAPAPDGSMISHYLLMQTIKEMGLKVVLSGSGGDEILAGYANTFVPAGNVTALASGDLKGLDHSALKATAFHLLPSAVKNRIFLERHRVQKFLLHPQDLDLIVPRYRDLGGHDLISRYAMHTLTHWTTPGFTLYEDRNSMASSVEARSPFYDYNLVQFALSLPGKYLIRKGWTKRILRDGLRGSLPLDIVDRRDKQGFHAPIKTWMNALDRDPLTDPGFIQAFDWLDLRMIMGSGFLYQWRLLALHVWYKTFWPDPS